MRSIQRSATLLIVMSSGYLASEWCAKERNAFLGFVRDCVAAGRIFIVHCRETDRTAIPPEFGDLIGFKFWTQDPEAGGATRPLGLSDVKERAYLAGVINLSDRLARTLKEIKAARKARSALGRRRVRRIRIPGALDGRFGNAGGGACRIPDPGRAEHPAGELVSGSQ